MKLAKKVLVAAQFIVGSLALSHYVGCAPVQFGDARPKLFESFGGGCKTDANTGLCGFDYTILAPGGTVDILIVNDNSGSMSFEQTNMAAKFQSFISTLDSQQVDYRIAITTTDIASDSNLPRAINNNGALQDGRLIPFEAGMYFLTPDVANREALFASTIQRPETQTCEIYLKAHSSGNSDSNESCPSGNERPLAAAYKTVSNNYNSFIRTNAHLAIVILTDEDTMSGLYSKSITYKLDSTDLPQTLISKIESSYGGKSVSIHSISVMPGSLKSGLTASEAADDIANIIKNPNGLASIDETKKPTVLFNTGDSACLNTQSSQINSGLPGAVLGGYSYLVNLGVRMTNGIEGDICANDYATQLEPIGENILNRMGDVEIACSSPVDLQIDFEPANKGEAYVVEGKTIKFANLVEAGTKIHFKYKCGN